MAVVQVIFVFLAAVWSTEHKSVLSHLLPAFQLALEVANALMSSDTVADDQQMTEVPMKRQSRGRENLQYVTNMTWKLDESKTG